jgi:outer membrane protein assembly factor BamB
MRVVARIIAVGLLSLLLVCSAREAQAGENQNFDAILDIPPDIPERLRLLNELKQEGKWELFFQRLADAEEEVEEAVWSADGTHYIPAKQYLRQVLLQIPKEGLAIYRLQFDATAAAALAEGTQKRDIPLLDSIEQRFPGSQHAEAALDAAANVLIDQGQYLAAVRRLRRLLGRPKTQLHSAADEARREMALAKLGFCLGRLGDRSGAQEALGQLRRRPKGSSARVAGSQSPVEFLAVELKREVKTAPSTATNAWPAPGGAPDNAAPMPKISGNLSRSWTLKIGDDTPLPPQPTTGRSMFSPHNVPPHPVVSARPIIDENGVIYANTGEGLYAVNALTGRVIWKVLSEEVPEVKDEIRFAWASRKLLVEWMEWAGAGTVSTGGGRVYATEILGGGSSLPRMTAFSAFDADTGKRLWRHLHGTAQQTNSYFTWAPKYIDGMLVGTIVDQDQAFLVALDAATGKIRWKVFLAADPIRISNTNNRSPVRPDLGYPVTIRDGVVYASTGMGAVAAVNLHGGELLWITRYPRDSVVAKRLGHVRQRFTRYVQKPGWEGGFPIVSHSKLYLVTWDAQPLLVFDCHSGQITRKIPRGDYRYFAGVHDGSLLLVGKEAAALDPHTGLLRWLVPMPFEPEGQPVVTESALLVPTAGRIVTVSLKEPVTRRTYPMTGADLKLPMGEVVSHDGSLVAANRAYLTVYASFREIHAKLSEHILKHPDAVQPRLDRADLAFLHGHYAASLRDLLDVEKALKAQSRPKPNRVSQIKQRMFETRLKLSETDLPQALHHIDAAKPYIFNPVAKARFGLARGAALAVERRYPDAVEEYLNLAEHLPNLRIEDSALAPTVRQLAQKRIGELIRRHGEAIYARTDAKLKPQYDALVKAGDVEGLRRIQTLHPHSSLADNCLLAIARIVAREPQGNHRAQTTLRSLTLQYPRSEVLGEAYAMLLQTAMTTQQRRLATVVLAELEKHHPDLAIPWGDRTLNGKNIAAGLKKDADWETAMTRSVGQSAPTLRFPLKKSWTGDQGPETPVTVLSEDNCFNRGVGLAVDVSRGPGRYASFGWINRLRAFDTHTGKTLWQAKIEASWSQGSIEQGLSIWSRNQFQAPVLCSGSVVVLGHPEGLHALDIETGKRLWEQRWESPRTLNPGRWFEPQVLRRLIQNSRLWNLINQRPVFAAEAGRVFYYLPDRTLVCLDAANGAKLWTAQPKGYAFGAIGLFEDRVVVAGLEPNSLSAFDIRNGKALYEKPLAGDIPGPPAFASEKNLIYVNDSHQVLSCHDATEFKPLWTSKDPSARSVGQPWFVNPLPDGRVAVFRYVKVGNQQGHGMVLHDGETGKPLWMYNGSTRATNKKDGTYSRSTMSGNALFGEQFVFISVTNYMNRRQARHTTNTNSLSLHVLDLKSGKPLHTFVVEPLPLPKAQNGHAFSYSQMLMGMTAKDHLLFTTNEQARNNRRQRFFVLDGTTGKIVHSEEINPKLLTDGNSYLMRSRLRLDVTPNGDLMLPLDAGIQGYASTPPEDKPPAADNTPAP